MRESPRLSRICPNPGDLPNVYLAVRDNVGTRRSQVAVHPGTNAIHGLPDVNRNLVKVAQDIAANFVCKRPDCPAPKRKINCQ